MHKLIELAASRADEIQCTRRLIKEWKASAKEEEGAALFHARQHKAALREVAKLELMLKRLKP